MLNSQFNEAESAPGTKGRTPVTGAFKAVRAAICALAVLAAVAGCKTVPPHAAAKPQPNPPPPKAVAAIPEATNSASTNSGRSLLLQEGDTIKILFPGAPQLDTTVPIRRDGKINLEMVGEYEAAGKTPAAMEADLKKLYASQIVNNDVSVTVETSAFVVYVWGAVNKPGKIISDRPLNVLEAMIEAGIDSTKSNLKAVQVLRTDSTGKVEKSPKLNFYKYIHSKTAPMPSFILKPYDIIFVPERFSFIN